MPHNFSWIVPNQLAGMGRPGCGLELAGQMLPYEQRFWSWLIHSQSLSAERQKLAQRIGLPPGDEQVVERRMTEIYRKFRDIWGLVEGVREGFGSQGEPIDRFVRGKALLESDLHFLKDQGVDTLVSLTETPLDEETVASFDFEVLHIPVPDRHAPTPDQIDTFTAFLDAQLGAGRSVLAHCWGGYGRTGTVLVCYLIHCGAPAREALDEMRRLRPGADETEEQEQAVFVYEERIR